MISYRIEKKAPNLDKTAFKGGNRSLNKNVRSIPNQRFTKSRTENNTFMQQNMNKRNTIK